MSTLARHLTDYLQLRRSMGFKLHRAGQVLPQFVEYLEAAGASTVTTDLAIAWAQLPSGVHPVTWTQRLGAVRSFRPLPAHLRPRHRDPSVRRLPGAG
ncbi:hypothetical protein ABT187_49075 [Streptomyces sp. NPDC001817]|uniref:hypothetical protein n=1 Tax=Streptomyces sp. NPDC001817 TaxID=3154398 RepID=UPI00331FE254